MSWPRRHRWAILGVAVALAVMLAFTAWQISQWGRVVNGVEVAGVAVGGLTAEEAAGKLRRELWPRISTAQLDAGGEEPLPMQLAQLGIALDAEGSAQAALAAARRELPFGLHVWLPGGGGEVTPLFSVDASVLEKNLAPLRELVDVPARDARLKLRPGWGITVLPSKDGLAADAQALSASIVAAASQGAPTRARCPPWQSRRRCRRRSPNLAPASPRRIWRGQSPCASGHAPSSSRPRTSPT